MGLDLCHIFGDIRHVMWWYRMAPGALIKNLIHWHTHTHTHSETYVLLPYYPKKIPHFFSTPYSPSHHGMTWHNAIYRLLKNQLEWISIVFVGDYVHYGEESWQRNSASHSATRVNIAPRKLLPIPHTAGIEEGLSVFVLYFCFTWNHWQTEQVTCSTSSMTMRNLAMANRSQPSHWYRYLWRSTNEAQEITTCAGFVFAAIWLLVHSPKFMHSAMRIDFT